MPLKIEKHPRGLVIAVKVVPNSSRDALVGLLGDALKIKVARPPEDGKANAAVLALLARTLGVAAAQISILAGQSQPHKRILIAGVDEAALQALSFKKA